MPNLMNFPQTQNQNRWQTNETAKKKSHTVTRKKFPSSCHVDFFFALQWFSIKFLPRKQSNNISRSQKGEGMPGKGCEKVRMQNYAILFCMSGKHFYTARRCIHTFTHTLTVNMHLNT